MLIQVSRLKAEVAEEPSSQDEEGLGFGAVGRRWRCVLSEVERHWWESWHHDIRKAPSRGHYVGEIQAWVLGIPGRLSERRSRLQ